MTRIDGYLESCMTRAAYKTMFCTKEQFLMLKELSLQANVWAYINTTIPHGWDGASFCENLINIRAKYILDSIFQNKSKKGFQATCYELACKRRSTTPCKAWTSLLSRRLKMFQTPDVDESSDSSSSSSSSDSSYSSSSSSLSPEEVKEPKVVSHIPIWLKGSCEVSKSDIDKLGKTLGQLPEGIRNVFHKDFD